ncbi:MAG: polyribonucleotide nucleotidyltransferase [bacterium]|nr:polyribonucleotide nucleotidyltransferase [bacterium]MDD4152510.1 polyribonucleotide nucleotidyltransferase [bacterium]
MEKIEVSLELGGSNISFETGKLARQANGAVVVRSGDTVLLVTATMSETVREGIDFFPLMVDFEEKFYAAGRIPGGYFKREGRPSERAVLTSRLIDRPIRPLFPKGMRNDVQIIVLPLSASNDYLADILAINGASLALSISDIPFNGPVGAVRIACMNDEYIVNPTYDLLQDSQIDMVVVGGEDAITTVQVYAREASEDIVLKGIEIAHEHIKKLIAVQKEMALRAGKEKREVRLFLPDEEIRAAVSAYAAEKLRQAVMSSDKQSREEAIGVLKQEVLDHFMVTMGEEAQAEIIGAFDYALKNTVRQMILDEQVRPDGRKPQEIRPISCEVGLLPMTHGSGLFTRGQTQVLNTVTLGSLGEAQKIESLMGDEAKRFMHHYNFPPYSVGEARPLRSPSRRDIGHGALAEKALLPMLPSEEDFPYAMRLVSDVLESNGSSSMASTCAGSLALMDAGVPVKKAVAGIAMGLVTDGNRHVVLWDIQGMEDALGDMDFKVAGTIDGINAIQMDIKLEGLNMDILREALEQAREGRLYILNIMNKAISEPRSNLSPKAPRIITLQIHPDKIGELIGPGGKTIKKIIEATEVKIDVEDDGKVYISSTDEESALRAVKMVENLTKEVTAGEIYTGRVTRIMTFGAFVEVLPGKEGLVHISELAPRRVERVEDVVNVGDEVTVKVIEIDRQGRINLTIRGLLETGGEEERSGGRRERGEKRPEGRRLRR